MHLEAVRAETSKNYSLIRDVVASIPDQLMQVVPDNLRPTVRSELQRVINNVFRQIARLADQEEP